MTVISTYIAIKSLNDKKKMRNDNEPVRKKTVRSVYCIRMWSICYLCYLCPWLLLRCAYYYCWCIIIIFIITPRSIIIIVSIISFIITIIIIEYYLLLLLLLLLLHYASTINRSFFSSRISLVLIRVLSILSLPRPQYLIFCQIIPKWCHALQDAT